MPGSNAEVGSATADPTLRGTEDEVLIQALRNLWPILDKPSRTKAIRLAQSLRED